MNAIGVKKLIWKTEESQFGTATTTNYAAVYMAVYEWLQVRISHLYLDRISKTVLRYYAEKHRHLGGINNLHLTL